MLGVLYGVSKFTGSVENLDTLVVIIEFISIIVKWNVEKLNF